MLRNQPEVPNTQLESILGSSNRLLILSNSSRSLHILSARAVNSIITLSLTGGLVLAGQLFPRIVLKRAGGGVHPLTEAKMRPFYTRQLPWSPAGSFAEDCFDVHGISRPPSPPTKLYHRLATGSMSIRCVWVSVLDMP